MNTDNKSEKTVVTAEDENKLIAQRREKLKALREVASQNGATAFPNDFRRDSLATELLAEYQDKTKEELEELKAQVS